MIHLPFCRSRHSPLATRHFFLRALCAVFVLCALCVNPSSSPAQNLDKPLQSIDEDITAFAFAPDGRIVYAVNRNLKTKHFVLEHDDIWLQETNGKRHRLIEAQKLTHGSEPFSYIVDSFGWSPNGHMIVANLLASSVEEDSGRSNDSFMALLLDDSGHEIKIDKGESIITDAARAFWLPDNGTLAYLSEAIKPRMLFNLKFANIGTGKLKSFYEGRTFRDVAPVRGMNFAVAIEQERGMIGPCRLQYLDLVSDNDTEIATLDGCEGGLSVSPSGKKVAYFLDKEVLEVRDLYAPTHVARARVGFGTFQWSGDESRILLKRAFEKKSAELVWVDLPPLAAAQKNQAIPIVQPTPTLILHGLTFRDFAISPDGRNLAVVIPGKRNLLVFPLPQR